MIARSAQHGACKALRVTGNAGTHHETSHGMAEQEQRQITRFAACLKCGFTCTQHIGNQDVFSSLERHASQFIGRRDAFSVTDMVVPKHNITQARQKTGKRIIALDVLRHAMDQLNYAATTVYRVGQPHHNAQPRPAVGGKRGGFLHKGIGITSHSRASF